MSKKEPDFNVNTDKLNSISDVAEKDFTSSFAESLVEDFQSGAYSILEAKRLVESKDLAKDLDLILNDEEHSVAYQRQRVIFNEKISTDDIKGDDELEG